MTNDEILGEGEHRREQLERRADIVRWRLMRALDALGRRRHEALDVTLQVRRHWVVALLVGGAAAAALAGAIVSWGMTARARLRHRGQRRWTAMERIWRHPEDVMRARASVVTTAIRSAATTLLTSALLHLGKRMLRLERRELPRPLIDR